VSCRLKTLLCAAWFAGSLLVAINAAADSKPQWHIATTSRFTIVSQLDAPATKKWADQLLRFTHTLSILAPIDESHLKPLTIVIFADDSHFAPYKAARPDGNIADIVGFFAAEDTWAVMGFSHHDDELMQQVLFHESVHWHLSAHSKEVPLWFEEGLAEVLSTTRLQRNRSILGAPIAEHVQRLKNAEPIPLDTLLSATHQSELFNDDHRSATFYAQSWAAVHELMLHKQGFRQNLLASYLSSLQLASQDSAYNNSVRSGDEFVDGHSSRFTTVSIPVASSNAPSSDEIVATPASVNAVELALARLAIGSHRFEVAELHRATLANNDPGTAADLQALLQWQQQQSALASAFKSIDHGSPNAQTLLIAANELWQQDSRANAKQVMKLASQAIQRWPAYQKAYQTLALAVKSIDTPSAETLGLLWRGHDLFPSDTAITLSLAISLANSSQPESALRLIKPLLEDRHAPVELQDHELQDQALLVHSWILQSNYNPRIKTLVNAGRFETAMLLANEYKQRCIEDTSLQAADAMQTYVYVAQQLQSMDAALQDSQAIAALK
jgi:hypothetical protein